MRTKNKNIVVIMLLLSMLMLFTTQIYASGTTPIGLNENDKAEIGKIVSRVSEKISGSSENATKIQIKTKDPATEDTETTGLTTVIEFKEAENKIIFHQDNFIKADKKEAKKALEYFIEELRTSSVSNNGQQNIMTMIQESNDRVAAMMIPLIFDESQADLFTAYKIIHPFLAVLSIVLGIGAYIIIFLLILSTVIDMLYIGLPVWREKVSENSKGSSNPFGVSYEALTTVKEIEAGLTDNSGGYRNAYLLYFKRRALSYILLGICILYLVAGQLGGIISFILNLVSGFM